MDKIIAISIYTVIENIRNRIYYIFIFFALVFLAVTMLLSVLGGEEFVRIIYDFGISIIEFFSLFIAVFSGVVLLLTEMESKTVYLILARPIPKSYYLLGRYLGLLISIYMGMLVMAIFHIAILLLYGWNFSVFYLLTLFYSSIKIMLITSIAIFFSLFSTSSVSAVVFTFFMWILGHFTREILFLINKMPSLLIKLPAKVLYYIIPNLQYLNIKEFSEISLITPEVILSGFFYGVGYSFLCILLSIMIFENREF